MVNRVVLFGLTALVLLLALLWVELLSFLSCLFLPTICCCWFLWNCVSTVEPHGAIMKNVHACSLNMCQLFLRLGWNCLLAQSLQELAQWVFELKKKKKKVTGKAADSTTVSLDLHGNESSKHLHITGPPSPGYCTHKNTHLTLTKKCLSSQALINMARHVPFTCIGSTNLTIF